MQRSPFASTSTDPPKMDGGRSRGFQASPQIPEGPPPHVSGAPRGRGGNLRGATEADPRPFLSVALQGLSQQLPLKDLERQVPEVEPGNLCVRTQ